MSTTEVGEPVDLRERRRRQTEREVGDVALRLFEERGVVGTTVDDIAHAAGISPRTFFRYFATKEAAALAGDPDLDARVDALVDGLDPAAPPVTQLETLWRSVAEAHDGGSEAGRRVLRVRRLALAEPALRLALLAEDERRRDRLVARVRDALGGDELEALVCVEESFVPLRAAFDHWARASDAGTPVGLLATYEQCIAVARRVRVGS
ncbi:MAG: TetR family transcriptional regulator [Nocardioides sp.]|nr:TetR family transcriptional regulator [Nocardioides sp.]